LAHHWRTSSHLRHVRTEAGARCEARTHLVHYRCLLAYLTFGIQLKEVIAYSVGEEAPSSVALLDSASVCRPGLGSYHSSA
jgi:hypothetical protein